MTFDVGGSTARIATRVRLALLLLVALFIAHDAIYVAQFGVGASLASAMRERGHDGYWMAMVAAALLAGSLIVVGVLRTMDGLRRRLDRMEASGAPRSAPADGPGPSYRVEVLRLWRTLLPLTLLLFGIQENLETFVAHGDVIGIEAIVGPGAPLAVPVLALVTLALAALGGLVRWRIAVLETRLSRAIERLRRQLLRALKPAREWHRIHASAPHRWIAGRSDAGRAPPRPLPA